MTDQKPPIDPPTTRTTRRLPPGVSKIDAGNPDDIFAPPPASGPASPAPTGPDPGEKTPSPSVDPPPADTPTRTGRTTARDKKDETAAEDAITIPTARVGPAGDRITAAAPAGMQADETAASSPGDKHRGRLLTGTGERLNRTVAKVVPSLASRRGPIDLAIAGLVILVVIAGVTWWAVAPTSDPVPQQTADAPAPKAPSPGDSTRPAAPPPASSDTPAPKPSDTAKGTPPESKPDPGASAGAPAAPANPPLLGPRTGPITQETLDLLKRRAAAGETDSMQELARRYIEGVGIEADAAEGTKWLLRAAAQGAPDAMFNIGVMYERGMVLDKDPARALDWYAKASAAGMHLATHNMALMYREGIGIAPDFKRAQELLLVAARNGMSASMFALAGMHEAGSHGLRKDLVQAIVWYAMTLHFQRAHPSTQDSEMAQKADQKVNELQRILSAADLNRAQALGEKEHTQIIDTIRAANKLPPSTATAAAPPNGSPTPSAPPTPAAPPATAPGQPGAPPTATTPTAPPAGKPGAPPATGKPPAGPQTASKSDPKGPAAPPSSASDKTPAGPQTATTSDPKNPATPPAPAAKPVNRKEQLTEIQKMLFALHYYRGKIDGTMGNDTRNAIKKVQAIAGMPQTGEPSQELLDVLRDLVQAAPKN